ncbi:MAG: hypothetical protein COW00_13310 [Bdellovibrio sp. CG12_big_fil_rev_8_21_14_0_65_39_13]|nr:MAG: hypothetical protein COW78_11360 [Bdellovibrio sp. CG22_combo_CG10-13_8_21_14_all_39_27]PIQ58908.1 MAG: hypothetical protein COW00_13310 [Bdellovibrio sp. CG12_big_fil_rev_8_21_14_0_65_39_13]PIR35999.1 MAG: hypothetical protein COV37_05685 [Bdellovibrio sp. CG11_big_fil_rev_8_21_14_0_20_39_38]PJB53436.1 MAG: hypothetical protein CO099_07150 [Bdellovibrio sp. CG_4_9_14_3_um_filter_39_7]
MRIPRKKHKIVKPNIIPIMDAVFIFIFFLLMSAQFLQIYEIGSDAPAVKTITEKEEDKKKPLNLTLEVSKTEVVVKTGLDGNVFRKIAAIDGEPNILEINKVLMEIKKDHVDETSVIIKPQNNVDYKKIVWVMDACREIEKNQPTIVTKNDKGATVQTRKLFEQIIFETM